MSTDDTNPAAAMQPRTDEEIRPRAVHSTGYDGPTIRAVRESMGVPLRRIARMAGRWRW